MRSRFWPILGLLSIVATMRVHAASREDLESCQQTGDIGKSITACSRLIEDTHEPDEDKAIMRLYRGAAFMSKGDLDRAIADFDQTLALDSQNIFAYLNRSIAYSRKANRDEAAKDYRRAVEINAPQVATMLAGNEELQGIRDYSVRPEPPAAPPIVVGRDPGDARDPERRIREMADNVAQRLAADGRDVDGWMRLIKAYKVLNDNDKLADVMRNARRGLKDDPLGMARLSAEARALGLEER